MPVPYYQRHIFFCLNDRENGEKSCAHDGAQQAFDHCKSRVKKAGGSFLSSNDPRELLGAGQTRIDRVEMHWPAPNHHVARYLTLTEGGT